MDSELSDMQIAINICKERFDKNYLGIDSYKNFVILIGEKNTMELFKKELNKLNIKPREDKYLQIIYSNHFEPGDIYIEKDKKLIKKYLLDKKLIKKNYDWRPNYNNFYMTTCDKYYKTNYNSSTNEYGKKSNFIYYDTNTFNNY